MRHLPEPVLLEAFGGEVVDDGALLAPPHSHVLALRAVGRLAPPSVAPLAPFPAVAVPEGVKLRHLQLVYNRLANIQKSQGLGFAGDWGFRGLGGPGDWGSRGVSELKQNKTADAQECTMLGVHSTT